MKLISKLHGSSAVRVLPDEAIPPGGIVFSSLISSLRETYKFTTFPDAAAIEGMPLMQLAPIGLGFQNGEFVIDGTRVPIATFQLFLNGLAVSSQSTELSDIILGDLIKLLDEKFGFRIADGEIQRSYISQV